MGLEHVAKSRHLAFEILKYQSFLDMVGFGGSGDACFFRYEKSARIISMVDPGVDVEVP